MAISDSTKKQARQKAKLMGIYEVNPVKVKQEEKLTLM